MSTLQPQSRKRQSRPEDAATKPRKRAKKQVFENKHAPRPQVISLQAIPAHLFDQILNKITPSAKFLTRMRELCKASAAMVRDCKSWQGDSPVPIRLPSKNLLLMNVNPNNQEHYILPEWFDLHSIKLTFRTPTILADETFEVIMNQPSIKELDISRSYIRAVPARASHGSSYLYDQPILPQQPPLNVSNANLDSVDLSHCLFLTDVSGFAGVRVLDISYCTRVSDVSCLGRVQHLNLTCCSVSNVSALTGAKTLFLAGTQVSDVSMLGNAHVLCLDHCSNVTDASALGNVHTLSLRGTRVSDASKLGRVHALSLAQTRVVDVSALGEVHTLNLSFTNVVDVSCLGSVHKLMLDRCERLKDVSSLSNVHSLSIQGNGCLTGVHQLEKVQSLNMIGTFDSSTRDVPENVFLTVPYLSMNTSRISAYIGLLRSKGRPATKVHSLYIDRGWSYLYYNMNLGNRDNSSIKDLLKMLARKPRPINFVIPAFPECVRSYTKLNALDTQHSQFKCLQLARASAGNGNQCKTILKLSDGAELTTTVGVVRQFKTLSDAMDCLTPNAEGGCNDAG